MNISGATEANLNILPLDMPVIAWFNYLNDCQVKIPVCIKEKNGLFFMKNPVKPNTDWKLNLIIRSIDFPEDHPIKFIRSPFNETDHWESRVIKKVAHSEFAEIYEVSEPRYFSLASLRRSTRIFCLVPIKCFIGESENLVQATCVDMSEDGSGMGLRFDRPISLQAGDICKIRFDAPFDTLPEIAAKVVRQSTSGLDRSVSAGLVTISGYQEAAQKSVQVISQVQASQNKEVNTQTTFDYPAQKGILSDIVDSLPKDFLSNFRR